MASDRVILFAGGGTGGHIFPNIAVLERLREQRIAVGPQFLLSDRPLDVAIVQRLGYPFTALSARPLGTNPAQWWSFYQGFKASVKQVHETIERTGARALVATGGYVSGPAMKAAHEAGLAVAMANLDAVPGKANRRMAGYADMIFSVYETQQLLRAQAIGLPLRRTSVSDLSAAEARLALGLDPDQNTLLVTAGSQGASTINQMLMELCTRTKGRKQFESWQVLHLSGDKDRETVAQAYATAGIHAVVEPFCNQMGLAWASATLAISRSGAGSVAEAWANATPTIFFPYPYHRDQHQRRNAEPLVNSGAALLMTDHIDPLDNVSQLIGPLGALMHNQTQRIKMKLMMEINPPNDGAATIAQWLMTTLGLGLSVQV